jgi:hypothetical protein
MIQKIFVDDDGIAISKDHTNLIRSVCRGHGYQPKSQEDLDELNRMFNRFEGERGGYQATKKRARQAGKARNALQRFKKAQLELLAAWNEVQASPRATAFLIHAFESRFSDFDRLIDFDVLINSAEMRHALGAISQHRVNRQIPNPAGAIPIAELVPELSLLSNLLQSALVPTGARKGTQKVLSMALASKILSAVIEKFAIQFSDSIIRNSIASYKKLPTTN